MGARATRQGKLPHVKLGRYRRYVRVDLETWIEAQKAGMGKVRGKDSG